MSGTIGALDQRYVELILDFLDGCVAERIAPFCDNKLLRDDVMKILENNSIVVYYPLDESEISDGFLLRGLTLYGVPEVRDFVFINTAKDTEKQVFAAAHELGHIWGLDSYFKENGLELDYDTEERVMNRFAAELMIPEKQFLEYLQKHVRKTRNDSSMPRSNAGQWDFFHTVAELMNEFFVPDKAIIWRLFELNCIEQSTAEFLINDLDKPDGSHIRAIIRKSIHDAGYSKLLRPTNIKWINDLPDLLDRAERKGAIMESKLNVMRERFDITQVTDAVELRGIDLKFYETGVKTFDGKRKPI